MSSKERKKKKDRSIYRFTNVSGAPLVLETDCRETVSRFTVKRSTNGSVLKRALFFFSLLVLCLVAVSLGLVDGWYGTPIFVFGVAGLLSTISKVVQGEENFETHQISEIIFCFPQKVCWW